MHVACSEKLGAVGMSGSFVGRDVNVPALKRSEVATISSCNEENSIHGKENIRS